jgi:hypothetical protein
VGIVFLFSALGGGHIEVLLSRWRILLYYLGVNLPRRQALMTTWNVTSRGSCGCCGPFVCISISG